MSKLNWLAIVSLIPLAPFIILGYLAGFVFWGVFIGWKWAEELIDWILA